MTPKSGILLLVSCVSAIAVVGCIFELTSGNPELGQNVTSLILGFSIPLSIVAFVFAVKDARANSQ
ncbi:MULTISPECIES: hypothetical protein [unclassified Cyanobacterium]|uniref:hypothetical protein n=1 Tax=unclassified Cyanobacterium TaxID=2629879 RepID=UPI0008528BD8|nr:hypothetical protein [Cyanobacterium sp. IPPAS B-1200]OEJ78984.1 hypothetical protein A5482_11855 [Cyanobacterium sp. IPPAS B-1200]